MNLGFSLLAVATLSLTSCSDDNLINPDSAISMSSDAASVGSGVSVSVSSLPASIKTYVSTNYASVTITKAEKYATQYEVTLSSGIKLEFTIAGAFIEISGSGGGNKTSDDPIIALPQAIKDYISKNHAGATVTKAEKSATKYEVTLSNGYKLEFTLTGQLIKSKYVGKKG